MKYSVLSLICLSLLASPVLAGNPAAATYQEAQALAAAGDYAAALAVYEELSEAHPDNADYLLGLGHMQLYSNKNFRAVQPLTAAMKLAPDNQAIYHALLYAYFGSGQSENAYALIQKAKQRFGEQPWMKLNSSDELPPLVTAEQ